MLDTDKLQPIHILLVEDNPHDVEITTRAFLKGKIQNKVSVARDGQEALDMLCDLKAKGDGPGLVLLDLNLPKVSGIDVLQKIKTNPETRRIPVIALTTSTREEDVVRAYDLGVNTFISKPVRFEDFLKVVTTIQEYWIFIATLPARVQV
jgi:CheY-like chemotaxis protein